MKKIIFTLLILTGLTVGMKAQSDAKLWIGGSLGLSTFKTSEEDSKTKNFQIAPEIGYNLSDTWAVGLAIGYGHIEGSYSLFGETESLHGNIFSISPFARYSYYNKGITSLFVDGGFTFATIHEIGDEDNLNAFEVGIRPGVALNVAPNVKLLAKIGFLGYQHTKYDEFKTDGFGLNLDLSQIQLGVNFLF